MDKGATLDRNIDVAVKKAAEATYKFNEWSLDNESDFKLELFHNLALQKIRAINLCAVAPSARTCALHAEAKVENGNPRKADLVICDPLSYNKFNYRVEAIIEIKQKLDEKELNVELDKFMSYKSSQKRYIISHKYPVLNPTRISEVSELHNVSIIYPQENLQRKHIQQRLCSCAMADVKIIVMSAINQTLELYGNIYDRHQSYFWRNYEHELEKEQTYPCEGDFVAHLYHRLRESLPDGLYVKSEVKVPGSLNRIDFVVGDSSRSWAISIDIKMNWDQFKKKYDKSGAEKLPEAKLIVQRLESYAKNVNELCPIVVVIQGEFRQNAGRTGDKRIYSMQYLSETTLAFDLISFNEIAQCVEVKRIHAA